jgi:hypothetical protein
MSGTVGGVDSSVSWMEVRSMIWILVDPILKQERTRGWQCIKGR